MKILNLYAGIGGNRKGWNLGKDDIVVAVEIDPFIAAIYQKEFPNDIVIIGDAHKYLLENFRNFDFIWASAPFDCMLVILGHVIYGNKIEFINREMERAD